MKTSPHLPNSHENALRIGVLGIGRLGRALVKSFQEQGFHVLPRDRRAKVTLGEWIDSSDVLCICVRDDQILEVVQEIAPFDLSGKTALLHAGTVPLSFLDALAQKGAVVGKFHPLMSFSKGHQTGIPIGTPFAFEGDIASIIKPWVDAWGAQLHRVEGEQWQAYHLAAVMAANFLPLFIRGGGDILKDLTAGDLHKALDWLAPLIQTSVANGLRAELENPFSGPAVRGDEVVMAKQAQYLKECRPEWEQLYRVASAAIQEMVQSLNNLKKT